MSAAAANQAAVAFGAAMQALRDLIACVEAQQFQRECCERAYIAGVQAASAALEYAMPELERPAPQLRLELEAGQR